MNAWGSNTDRILLLLAEEPMTKAELCRKLDLTHDQISSRLTKLKTESKRFGKRIHISGYTRHAILGKQHIRAIYALGDKPDAKRNMQKMTQKERSARSYVKRILAVRNSSIFRLTMKNRELNGL